MMEKAEQLFKLAEESSFKLSGSERELLQKVIKGEDANYSADEDASNELTNFAEWDKYRTLSASLIIWLCTDLKASSFFTHRGLRELHKKDDPMVKLVSR